MFENRQILHRARELQALREPFALATVVRIGGSTYRRPGARMLIDMRGQTTGAISGGCLEAEVAERAIEQLRTGRPDVHPFTLGEDDVVLGFGTGCNGVVHVLIEPFVADRPVPPLEAMERVAAERRTAVFASVLTGSGGWELCIGRHAFALPDAPIEGVAEWPEPLTVAVETDMRHLLADPRDRARQRTWINRMYASESAGAEVLLEVIPPPIRLFVFGEGHDIGAVVRLARPLGWEVWIVGRKPEDELARRFPDADRTLFLMHPEEAVDRVPVDAHSAAFVMNHQYLRDRAVLSTLLASPIPYIGMLGPASRTQAMREELAGTGASGFESRVFGPIGLDIGTEAPEQIALAALAEAQAVLHGRHGGSLRDRQAAIH